jgi:hypothetical protein
LCFAPHHKTLFRGLPVKENQKGARDFPPFISTHAARRSLCNTYLAEQQILNIMVVTVT